MSIPSKCIPVSDARGLRTNWLNTRQNVIDNALGYQDQNEIFFSVAELETFLNYVKNESARGGITNPGIRIYFAGYNNATSNLATIFLAPTKGDTISSDNNYNIRPYNGGQGGMPPVNY
jgi:hypothetical protein